MTAAKIIFWMSIALIVYTYFGYVLILWMLVQLKKLFGKNHLQQQPVLPTVSVVVPAYNEEECIEKKILNTLSLTYPKELLQIFFVADGSDDDTCNIVKKFQPVELLFEPERKGKMAAINRAMQFVKSEVVVFSDANSLLNTGALMNMMKHFSDEKTGGVAGEKKIVMPFNGDYFLGIGEGIYWKYESTIKQIESDFHTVIAAAGELFSMRTKLFRPLPEDTVLDDFMLGINICKAGYVIKYEKNAFATEFPSANIKEETKRKIRIGAGAAQALVRIGLPSAKDWLLNIQYFSRRVIRWLISPIALIVILLCNIFICLNSYDDVGYDYLLLAQLVFYCMAVFGSWTYYTRQRSIAFLVPFYFVFMNWCMLAGFIKQLFKKQTVLWEKSKRIQQNATPSANIS